VVTPLEALEAHGRSADWLHRAQQLDVDTLGTFRYDLHPLRADAIRDLALLSLDGWNVYVVQGYSGTVRTILRPPATNPKENA
jgi:hypothetical protein